MLKKLGYAFLSFTILLIFWLVANQPLFSKYSNNFEVYLDCYSSQCKIISVNEESFPFLSAICGQAVIVDGIDKERVLNDFSATVKFSEDVDGGVSYYAYTDKIANYIFLKGYKINLHIVEKKDNLKIGSPLIFGSF